MSSSACRRRHTTAHQGTTQQASGGQAGTAPPNGQVRRRCTGQQGRHRALTSFFPRLVESLTASLVCSSMRARAASARAATVLQFRAAHASATPQSDHTIFVMNSHTMSSRIFTDAGSGFLASPNPYIICATVRPREVRPWGGQGVRRGRVARMYQPARRCLPAPRAQAALRCAG